MSSQYASGSGNKTFDMEALLNRLDGDMEAAKEMTDLFASDTVDVIAELRSASDQSDWDLVARNAHTLRGVSANLGAMALAGVAAEIEKVAKGPEKSGLDGLLALLDQEFSEFKESVKRAGM